MSDESLLKKLAQVGLEKLIENYGTQWVVGGADPSAHMRFAIAVLAGMAPKLMQESYAWLNRDRYPIQMRILGNLERRVRRGQITLDELERNAMLRRIIDVVVDEAGRTGSELRITRLLNAVDNAATRPQAFAADEPRLRRLLQICEESHLILVSKIGDPVRYVGGKFDAENELRLTSRPIGEMRDEVVLIPGYGDREIAQTADDVERDLAINSAALADLRLLETEGLLTPSLQPHSVGVQDPASYVRSKLASYVDDLGHVLDGCRLTHVGRVFRDLITERPDEAESKLPENPPA